MDTNNVPPKDPQPEKKDSLLNNPIRKLRTYKDDIIGLIRQKKISEQELKKLDPALIKEAQNTHIDDEIKITLPARATVEYQRPVNTANTDIKKPELIKPEPIKAAIPKPTPKPTPKPVPKPAPVPKPVSTPTPKPKPVPPPPPPPPKELSPIEKLEKEEAALTSHVESEYKTLKELQAKEVTLEADKQKVVEAIKPIRTHEIEIEAREATIRAEESMTQFSKQRTELEQQRWKIEDERHGVEQQRWNMDTQTSHLGEEIVQIQSTIDKTKKIIQVDTTKIDSIHKKEAGIKAEDEKKIITKQLDEVEAQKVSLEKQWKEINTQKQILLSQHEEISSKVKAINDEILKLESQEHKASDPAAMHQFEEARFNKDNELRTVEQQRVKVEVLQGTNEELLKKVEQQSADILSKEKSIKEKIKELDKIIKVGQEALV